MAMTVRMMMGRAVLSAMVVLGVAQGIGAQAGSPAGPVPIDVLEARRAAFLELLDGAPAFVGAGSVRDLETEYLQDSDFRQSNNFFYLTGLEIPEAWLAFNMSGRGSVTLYVPERDPAREAWTGPKLGPESPETVALSGIRRIRSTSVLEEDMTRWSGMTARHSKVLTDYGHPEQADALRSWLGPLADGEESATGMLSSLRQVKDADELVRIRRALEITMEAHREAFRLAEPGVPEYALEAAIEYVFRVQGAERVGFPPIVGSGPNSVILHYDKSRRTLEDGDLVVVDIGAEFGYYTADIARTLPASGVFSERQRAVYELVLATQQHAIDAVRPGITMRELNQAARSYLEEHSGDVCGSRSCNRSYIHGLSHWLGMDVHDVGDDSRVLEPGMVLTIEPGIYLPEEGFGVRIEDVVLVTDNGGELLTRDLPRDADEIERLMTERTRWLRR